MLVSHSTNLFSWIKPNNTALMHICIVNGYQLLCWIALAPKWPFIFMVLLNHSNNFSNAKTITLLLFDITLKIQDLLNYYLL